MIGYVGLGSNLGDRRQALQFALSELAGQVPSLGPASSVWETEPQDGAGPPRFLNMVLALRTTENPLDLLDVLQRIERAAGRRRRQVNEPRPLDLDLLLLGSLELDEPRLVLPHPRMWSRRFVLAPLCEIDPQVRDPRSGRTAAELLEQLPEQGLLVNLGPLALAGFQPL